MRIVSKVGDKSFEFTFHPDPDNEHLFLLTHGKKQIRVEIIELKQDSVTISIDNRVRFFELKREDGKIREVTSGARLFPVEVRTPQEEELANVLASYETAERKSVRNEVKAPMPGKILEILVKPGEKVEIGKVVAILEAMKMENEISSDIEGIVENIKVHKDESVALDQVLIEFNV